MSVYKPDNKPFYYFDFQIKRRRFFGSTGTKNEREAKAVERAEKDKARALVRQAPTGVETLDAAAGKYWMEVGQHYVNAETTATDIDRLLGFLGKDKKLTAITDSDVNNLVTWRRGHRVKGGTKLVSAATVNRSTTQVLQAIFTRARKKWGVRFDHEPDWREHRLKEPVERVRELRGDEGSRIEAEIRADYLPFFDFVRAVGQRQKEHLIRWPEVDWETRLITTTGKRGRPVYIPITPVVREILWPLRGHHPEFVFTFVAARTVKSKGLVKGQRYPMTVSGVKTAWRRLRAKAGVNDFRFHDFRHDFATKLLRETGNLRLAQKALNHADIKTTARYAHVVDEDIREGVASVQKSRHQSRPTIRKAS